MEKMDYVEVAQRMNPKDLETILELIPIEPNSVKVSLYGAIDYSSIFTQIKSSEGLEIYSHGGLPFELRAPTKDKILSIYRKQFVLDGSQIISDEVHNKQAVIKFNEAYWYKDDVAITLTPYNIEVKYKGKEPDYISKIRRAVSERGVNLKIEVMNNQSFFNAFPL